MKHLTIRELIDHLNTLPADATIGYYENGFRGADTFPILVTKSPWATNNAMPDYYIEIPVGEAPSFDGNPGPDFAEDEDDGAEYVRYRGFDIVEDTDEGVVIYRANDFENDPVLTGLDTIDDAREWIEDYLSRKA